MMPMPPGILSLIAALPRAVIADVLRIFDEFLRQIEVPQKHSKNTQNDANSNLLDGFEHTQKHSNYTQFDVSGAIAASPCQVPPAPLPSSISQLESREEGSKENKALPRKASTLTAARAREFEEFWNAFPKRINKQAALKRFEVALKSVESDRILNAAKAYSKATQATEKQFIKAPDVWLNKGCYDDELPLANGADHPVAGHVASVLVKQDTPQWEAWEAHYRTVKGKPPPTHNGGWHFPTEWPPKDEAEPKKPADWF